MKINRRIHGNQRVATTPFKHIFHGTSVKEVMSVMRHWWMLVIGGDDNKSKCGLSPYCF